ncbi:DUF3426 domain-containing protein [Faucicola mancuniensis]|uniref:DUF3426 domain-containing protein n=1 Tax=Faucicola mancuniensis TaxID=1309795 RepID=UPI003977CBE8
MHETKCPNCQHTFSISDEQLNLKSGYARCGNCKTIFSAIDNLLSSVQREPLQRTSVVASNPVEKKLRVAKAPKKIADGDLIFDDNAGIGIEDSEPLAKTEANFDIIDNFDVLPANKIANTPKNEPTDEAWLIDLLEEEKRKEEAMQYMPDNDKLAKVGKNNDVTSMLDELGVDVAEEAPLEDEDYRKKVDERFSQQVASQKIAKNLPVGMMLIWGLGSLLLIGLLGLQYVIFNLDSLLKDPEKAAKIHSLCAIVSCDLPIANVSMLKTETLNLAKGTTAAQSDVTFTITNTTDKKMIYPNLKISLRDSNDIKAQLVISPTQYLDNDGYLMPGQIKPVKLRIDYPKNDVTQANIEPFY